MLYFCGLAHQFRGWVQMSMSMSACLSVGLPAHVPRGCQFIYETMKSLSPPSKMLK
jgi:hypothetical protein